ncbi:MAG: hypothetical protein ABJC04_07390 [Verrucomicrobiota bacterium]
MKSMKCLLVVAVMASLSLTACKKGEGEKMGESMDKAAEKTGDAMKEGADKTKDAANDAADKVKDAVNK